MFPPRCPMDYRKQMPPGGRRRKGLLGRMHLRIRLADKLKLHLKLNYEPVVEAGKAAKCKFEMQIQMQMHMRMRIRMQIWNLLNT